MDDKGIKYKKKEFLENKYYRKLKICDIKLKNYDDEKELIKCEHHSINNLLSRISNNNDRLNKKIEEVKKKSEKYKNMLNAINNNTDLNN